MRIILSGRSKNETKDSRIWFNILFQGLLPPLLLMGLVLDVGVSPLAFTFLFVIKKNKSMSNTNTI